VKHPPRKRLKRALLRPPFADPRGRKGWAAPLARAQKHRVRMLSLQLVGWPRWPRPMRIVLLADLHTGSHTDDVERISALVAEAQGHRPDLVLFGGDYVNMQVFGGGRVPPAATAEILARLQAPLGRIAVIGNHDIYYGADEVTAALAACGICVLDDTSQTVRFEGHDIAVVGIPDGHVDRPDPYPVLAALPPERPTIVLAHDPMWFAQVRSPAHLTLAGHTHGGQVRLPFVGAVVNASKAPLRWSYGLIVEEGRHLYVTSGLGTSNVPVRIGIPPEYVVIDINGL
jgi:predicted MPP superfamily phosphohydrolase